MAYKSYPWYCMVCDRWFQGGMGRASHYRSKKHKENAAKLQARNAEAVHSSKNTGEEMQDA